MASSLFSRGRASSKVGVEYDQEGKEVNVETREDEEQQIRFKEIINLLVAAGYFRARIKGLSAFDNVVGGMTWCISNCNFDIDVDLLFQENSTIGQKISLTEKIVRVLPKMKCPQRIEPHQIQGLDFKSIFPVIQWLVKKVIETREEMGDHIRAYSIAQFNKHHKMSQDIELEAHDHVIRDAIQTLSDAYRPVRRYRRDNKSSLTTEEAKVSSTLLEYGKRYVVSSKVSKESGGQPKHGNQGKDELESAFTKVEKGGDDTANEEESIQIAQEKTLQVLMDGMSKMSGREIEGKLASRVIGSIVEMQSSEIQEMSTIFAQKKKEMESSVKVITPKDRHIQVVTSLKEKVADRKEVAQEAKRNYEEILPQKTEAKQKLLALKEEKIEIKEKMQELEDVETQADKETLQILRQLISMNENLKAQEAQFKHHCKDESVKLNHEITRLKDMFANNVQVVDENTSLVEKQWNQDSHKLAKLRLLLAAKNRQVASLTRKIDEVPTRAELTQYQRRFVELYDQIASTHIETKQFYTMYNTQDDSRRYLEKEADLLDSIHDNFQAAKSSSSNMLQYLKQFEKIVEGIKANKIQVEKKRQVEKMKRDEINERYLDLVEKHRLYVKTIRDFQDECRKNEILINKLNQ